MTLGEKLLDLTAEYQNSKEAQGWGGAYGIKPTVREPSEVAADYETALRELLAPVALEER